MELAKLIVPLVALSVVGFGQAAAPAAPQLVCLYLDLNSMTAADLATAQARAIQFVQQKIAPSNEVTILANTSHGVNVLTDFTNNHDTLVTVLRSIMPGDTPAAGSSTRLQALQTAAGILGGLPEKKIMVYISAPTSVDNQPDLDAVVTALSRANIAVYPINSAGPQ